jgi:hypothetical protein
MSSALRRHSPAHARGPRWMSPKRRARMRPPVAEAAASDYPEGSDALGVGSPMLAPETEYATGERDLGPSAKVEELSTRFGELEAELEELAHAVDARRGARRG